MKKVIIIGGGLGGLISGIQLARAGIACTVIEKKSYPFHRVCGEYISNEAVPFLRSLDLYPDEFNPPILKTFELSSVSGRSVEMPLSLGGFGISRFTYDTFLYRRGLAAGVTFLLDTEAEHVDFNDDLFSVRLTGGQTLHADVVLGCFGKRSKLDVNMNRRFVKMRSPFVGIKYHALTDFPNNRIALHNFPLGYCGVSNVEDGKTNICYLSHRDSLKKYRSIPEMEAAVLFKNPLLRKIFKEAKFLWDKPEVINEVSFATKEPVENHVLMVGDAAGMITPLCGNGMAMAIRGAKIAAELTVRFCGDNNFSRTSLETLYAKHWRANFAARLWRGRQVQRLFGSEHLSSMAVNLAMHVKPVANAIIRSTHGEPF